MNDPNYVYKPWSQERREAHSKLMRKKRGTPDGHKMLYGVPVEEWKFKHIAPIMYAAKEYGHTLETIQWSIGLMVLLLSKASDDQA